jgi:hypothetical protein
MMMIRICKNKRTSSLEANWRTRREGRKQVNDVYGVQEGETCKSGNIHKKKKKMRSV